MTKYVVINENALCYRIEGSIFFGVLAGNVLRGGPDPYCGMIIPPDSHSIRPATLKDFDLYRVSSKGHVCADKQCVEHRNINGGCDLCGSPSL